MGENGSNEAPGMISQVMRILGQKRMAKMSKKELSEFQSSSAYKGWAGMSATERQIEMKRRMALRPRLRRQRNEDER